MTGALLYISQTPDLDRDIRSTQVGLSQDLRHIACNKESFDPFTSRSDAIKDAFRLLGFILTLSRLVRLIWTH